MATAFVSHSSADKYFADLLVKILQYHHIEFWYDSYGIEPGKKYKDEIQAGLKSADYLIVIVSENSLNSKWVARELAEFLAIKPNAHVIPLLLSPIPVDEVFDGLKEYQAIFFYDNMLNGFKELLSFFEKEFLPHIEKRQKEDRRDDERRKDERRTAPVIQRLRIDMWKYYERETGRGKFDPFNNSTVAKMDLTNRFMRANSVLSKYNFTDKSSGEKAVVTEAVLMGLLYTALDKLQTYNHLVEVIVVETLAEELNNMFDINIKERRDAKGRRANLGRRDPKKS